MLTWVKAIHTLVFVVVFAAILFLLYCGIANQLSPLTAVAFGLVLVEVVIYVGYRFRCPLRTLAEKLTPEGSPVTDIYLPNWLSKRVVSISTPLLLVACGVLLIRLLMR